MEMALLHAGLTEQILGVYYDVYAELGHGFLEKICQRAMVIALRDVGLSVAERAPFPVHFRGELLGDFFADVVVNGLVLVEIKATGGLRPWDEAQTLNYLRASRLEVALILNFGPKREHWRRILTNDRKPASSSNPPR
jgi:GxxExxY protein